MRLLIASLVIGLLPLAGCRMQSGTDDRRADTWQGATILIGIDGLRWDYPSQHAMPEFNKIADRGVRADVLTPVFPTKTFPNFYALATGLHPSHTGVVDNTMYDPVWDARFTMRDTAAVRDGRWWDGEPIWVTAEKQGLKSAVYFWPGSEAEIAGYRPTEWKTYDGSIRENHRADQVLDWLAAPPEERPDLVLLYFSSIDDAGHRFGPESPETRSAVKRVDRILGSLRNGLADQGILDLVNLVIVSDHGMTPRSDSKVIFLDDYLDIHEAGFLSLGQHITFWPQPEAIESVYLALAGAHPALKVYKRDDLPTRYHLSGHRRTPPIVAVPAPGWTVSTHEWAAGRPGQFSGGAHGYDNAETDMQGVFVAAGPAFNVGVRIETIRAVDIYNLVARSIGVAPASNDGDASLIRKLMTQKKR